MGTGSKNSLNSRQKLNVGEESYTYFSIPKAIENGMPDVSRLPRSLKVLVENLLRNEDGVAVTEEDIKVLASWGDKAATSHQISYHPARVLMQDFTGVPAVVDLAALRDAMKNLGGDLSKINPLTPVDLVIDHSLAVDVAGTPDAFDKNVDIEYKRNKERYEFLRWGSKAFDNFRVVPPGVGICHQVNLECLGQSVWTQESDGETMAYPDTLVGTDSHTTMINALGILGWGVGGIEAEAAMLGQPVAMLIPEVVGFKLSGSLSEGTTATDLVLTVTQMLREHGVVGKFVEFYGDGLDSLSLPDRATLSNMAPEYGATCGFFPIDDETLRFLKFSGREDQRVALVEAYAKEQGLWRTPGEADPQFTETLSLDVSTVVPSLSGPKRPQDRVLLSSAKSEFEKVLEQMAGSTDRAGVAIEGSQDQLSDGDIVIAAITSCTNTSNPSVMLAAGLVARNAVKKGLKVKPWVKTSLAPGSQVVSDYLEKAGLQDHLDSLGFQVVGYGCTTCIGNSGPLDMPIQKAVEQGDLVACSVLSGNRNFEGRISQQVRANYLASPPLVVAYAIAGSLRVDLLTEALGQDQDGNDVFLKDIWPSNDEIQNVVQSSISREMFVDRYSNAFEGDAKWQAIGGSDSTDTYGWVDESTYIKHPSFFEGMTAEVPKIQEVTDARPLALLGDSVTTDHISPAGAIKADGPAGAYLAERNVSPADFNSFGSRRGNHEIMMRGTFANIRLRNEMAPGTTGGVTRHMPSGEQMSIFEASMKYQSEGTALVVIAGKEYGTGSSRDWAAKGTTLLGVKAVVAESYERIHRSNLIGMGVLPLQFPEGLSRESLKLDGSETFDITGFADSLRPAMEISMTIKRADGSEENHNLLCRIDTENEVEYYRNGGILQYVLRNLL